MNIFEMSIRSILYRRKQYVSLFLVCVFGVGISLFSLFLVRGMLNSLEDKARVYYGGTLLFLGKKDGGVSYNKGDYEKLKSLIPEGYKINKRIEFRPDDSTFYFEGSSVKQRLINAVNFLEEETLFNTMNIVDGDYNIPSGTNGIFFSKAVSETLGCHVGDKVTFVCRNFNNNIDSMEFMVQGIFNDSSIFGKYTVYMDIKTISNFFYNREDYYNRLALTSNFPITEKKIKNLNKILAKDFNMYPLVEDKQDFLKNRLNVSGDYGLIKLHANLQDVKMIIRAMRLITGFVIFMLVLIIVIGVSCTFRVVVMKRVNEIGIYKAIGMKRFTLYKMFLSESFMLLVIGCLAGFLFALLLCTLFHEINLNFIPTFDIFLNNGFLSPVVSVSQSFSVTLSICLITVMAVTLALKKSIDITPCQALACTD